MSTTPRPQGPGRVGRVWLAVLVGVLMVTSGVALSSAGVRDTSPSDELADEPGPHVVVGIGDTGINPYHEVYYRPNLTEHPCTYLPEYPCRIPAFNLTVGTDDIIQAYEQDREEWNSLRSGQWYWIPQTNIIAVSCTPSTGQGACIFGSADHGTGTTSSVLTENPDALIAFQQNNVGQLGSFNARDIPVDVFSASWSHEYPTPAPKDLCRAPTGPLYVKSSGNIPSSTLMDCWDGAHGLISVGGGYAESSEEEAMATKHPDVVSYYCRPTAKAYTIDEYREYCGTSFSAPTVAGALSKVILEVRRDSGYEGTLEDGFVDPIAGVTVEDVRDAMNRTATYTPAVKYDNTNGARGVPLNPAAPWTQWGWGFYDGWVANATVDHLLGTDEAPAKPLPIRLYMEAQHEVKKTLYDQCLTEFC